MTQDSETSKLTVPTGLGAEPHAAIVRPWVERVLRSYASVRGAHVIVTYDHHAPTGPTYAITRKDGPTS